MQKLMIIDNDILYIQKMVNNALKELNGLKLHCFYTNKDLSILKSIRKNEVDIILLNADSFGLDILEYIYKNSINFYKKSIILILKNTSKTIIDIYDKYIYYYVKEDDNIFEIINALKKLMVLKEGMIDEAKIKNNIKAELEKLSFDFNNIGTKYILDCIYLSYTKKIYNLNLSRDVYPILSKKYKKSINTIRCDITTAIRNMYYNCESNYLMKYFGYLELSKPVAKEVITTISEKI